MIAQNFLREQRRRVLGSPDSSPLLPRVLDRYPRHVAVDFRGCPSASLRKYVRHFDFGNSVNLEGSHTELAAAVARHYDKQLDASEEEILPAFVEYVMAYSGGNTLEETRKTNQPQPQYQREKRTRKRTRRLDAYGDDSSDEEFFNGIINAENIINTNSTVPVARTTAEQAEAEVPYCICKSASYGEMIACDNPQCEIEWFHVGCVGVDPSDANNRGAWFCPQCRKNGQVQQQESQQRVTNNNSSNTGNGYPVQPQAKKKQRGLTRAS